MLVSAQVYTNADRNLRVTGMDIYPGSQAGSYAVGHLIHLGIRNLLFANDVCGLIPMCLNNVP